MEKSLLEKRENRIFYFVNVGVVLVSALFILYGFRGMQKQLTKIMSGSVLLSPFALKTLGFLVLGGVFGFFVLRFLSVRPQKKTASLQKSRNNFLVLAWIFYFLAFSLLVLEEWALNRFPIDQPEVVYFTLLNIRGGVDSSIFIESGKRLVVCLLISFAFFLVPFCYQKRTGYFYFSSRICKSFSLNLLYLIFTSAILFCSLFYLYFALNINEYATTIKKYSEPAVDSDFYLSEYITPKYENIVFPEDKKNLIVILMESMESSFSDKESGGVLDKNLIPHLTKIADENVNFSGTEKLGGGIDLSGTGWTIAGMTAKFAALPYNIRGAENQNSPFFLPAAVTLTDILSNAGYRQRFIFGSDKHFASRDSLLETHGNVEIHDIAWYKTHGMLPKSYNVFWGFEDSKLFDFAKYELSDLASLPEPFMLGLLTVDTHMPTGYQCKLCPETEDMPLKNTILCADNLVYDFLEWCKTQTWYEQTVIVLMGDHLFMATHDTNPFGDDSYLTAHRLKSELGGMDGNPRRWLDIFINADFHAEKLQTKNRKFSSFDMFPTILASLGCEIAGNRLGFGTNLFSDEKTLTERFSEEYINENLMKRNRQYENLELFSTE